MLNGVVLEFCLQFGKFFSTTGFPRLIWVVIRDVELQFATITLPFKENNVRKMLQLKLLLQLLVVLYWQIPTLNEEMLNLKSETKLKVAKSLVICKVRTNTCIHLPQTSAGQCGLQDSTGLCRI